PDLAVLAFIASSAVVAVLAPLFAFGALLVLPALPDFGVGASPSAAAGAPSAPGSPFFTRGAGGGSRWSGCSRQISVPSGPGSVIGRPHSLPLLLVCGQLGRFSVPRHLGKPGHARNLPRRLRLMFMIRLHSGQCTVDSTGHSGSPLLETEQAPLHS